MSSTKNLKTISIGRWLDMQSLNIFIVSPPLQMAQSDDLDNDIDELLHDFESKCQRSVLHCVLFY